MEYGIGDRGAEFRTSGERGGGGNNTHPMH